ncbi:hypothetical protein ACG02S_24530 [Roseateles sp. DC23W]|uniref:Uncharacterized protein n=1 Tax=Pelomonas dachongensis TaxID=3299029 RepID=A0ABW7EUF4_9BURK
MPGPRHAIPDAAAMARLLADLTRPSRIAGMEGVLLADPVAQDVLSAADLVDLWRQLHSLGVEALAPVGYGASSVVFDVGHGLAVRLGVGAPADVPRIAGVIQPLARGPAGGARFELMPLAATAGITDSDVLAVAATLARQGYAFSDPGPDNVGRVDGELLVIDPGAVSRR